MTCSRPLIRSQIPQVCRGGSKSLTSSGVAVRSQGKDPSPVPRPLVKARGAVHPLPRERENPIFGAPVRAVICSLSLGERVTEVRGRVRGAFPAGAPLRGQATVKPPTFPGDDFQPVIHESPDFSH